MTALSLGACNERLLPRLWTGRMVMYLQTRRRGQGMKLTRRGWLVLVVIPSFLAMWGVWEIAGHLWYVGDGGTILGYCWGTMEQCFKGGL